MTQKRISRQEAEKLFIEKMVKQNRAAFEMCARDLPRRELEAALDTPDCEYVIL